MTEHDEWTAAVDRQLREAISGWSSSLTEISAQLVPFASIASSFFKGGKKFRALCTLIGYRCINQRGQLPATLVDVASALELFHGAALIHDDIMDRSDTRRGAPAVHKEFENLHTERNWVGSGSHFGSSAALLLGDLVLSWSDELFARGVEGFDAAVASVARNHFDRMRWDVTAGQYLDMVEEHAWPEVSAAESAVRAETVLIYKSAKYSVEAPLLIGAALAGASSDQASELGHIGVALGTCFQLRDDMLGVFGDSRITGKPTGDDLREGKRTLLIATAVSLASADEVDQLNHVLGNPDASEAEILQAQNLLTHCGARAAIEAIITERSHVAEKLIERSSFDATSQETLRDLTQKLISRQA